MNKVIKITEGQYSRLLLNNLNEVFSPLRELMTCRITEDKKYVVYKGQVYSSKTGEVLPLTEQALGVTKALGSTGKIASSDDGWSISDILHTGVDIVSTAADFIVPGSGLIIDVVHALSYVVEAQFSSGEEKDTLYLMAAITGMFALIPGALQAVAPILKRFVKSGGKMLLKELPMVKKAWDMVSKHIGTFLNLLPKSVDEALGSKLGQKLLGKNADKISKGIKDFSSRIKTILEKLKNNTDATIKSGKKAIKKVKDVVPKAKKSIQKRIIDPLTAKSNLKNWNSLLKKGKVVSKKGNVYNITSTQGRAIIAANPEKYIDDIIFDAETGGAFIRNSEEGMKIISKNKEFIKSAINQSKKKLGTTADDFISDKVPEGFRKSIEFPGTPKGKPKLTSPKLTSTKEVSKVLGVELKGIAAAKKLYQNSLKSLSKYPKMASFFKPFLSGLFPPTAVYKMGKYMLKFVKGAEGTSRYPIAAQVVGFWLYTTFVANLITHYLCGLGLKDRVTNQDEFIKAVEDKNFNLLGVSDPLEFSLLNTIMNLLIALPKSYVKTIFQFNDCDTPLSVIYSPVKEIYDSAPGYFKGTPVEKLLISVKNLPESINNKVGTEKETGDSMYKKWDGGNKGE
jgi:hypothetical protein